MSARTWASHGWHERRIARQDDDYGEIEEALAELPTMTDEMPHCETCKHWDHQPEEHWPDGVTCMGWCTAINERGNLAIGYGAAWISSPALFATRKDFGCVLHEARDEE